MKPCFFPTAGHFREWLQRNHDKEDVLLVGFYKRSSGLPSMTWSESVDQALCFGWIDGVRKRIDDSSYTIRFSRRRPRSIWSVINLAKAKDLIKNGLMYPAGMAAWEKRDEKKSATFYSYQQVTPSFSAADKKRFRANKAAWKYFSAQPPGYRKMMTYWVVSAKREETRAKRLKRLIDTSAKQKRL